jgi:hypothetical protein
MYIPSFVMNCSGILNVSNIMFMPQQFERLLWLAFLRVRVTLHLAVYCQSVHLDAKPIKAHNQRFCFLQLNLCGNSSYVISSQCASAASCLQLSLQAPSLRVGWAFSLQLDGSPWNLSPACLQLYCRDSVTSSCCRFAASLPVGG